MAKTGVVYVAWPQAEAGDLNQEAEDFKKGISVRPTPKPPKLPTVTEWKLVYSDQPGQLVGLPADSQIFVLGHSDKGKEWITNRSTELKYDIVCDRLIACGLSEHYAGKLKFYNCFNALDASAAKGENSFASQAAQYLRKKEFKNTRIFGYAGILCEPVPGRQKMYVAYGSKKAEYGAKAVRVEYDRQGFPMRTQPIVAAGEEYSSWDEED